MGTNNYIAKLKARLDQAIIQRDHWKQVAAQRNFILVTETDPETRTTSEYRVDADSVRGMWAYMRKQEELIAKLQSERQQEADNGQ